MKDLVMLNDILNETDDIKYACYAQPNTEEAVKWLKKQLLSNSKYFCLYDKSDVDLIHVGGVYRIGDGYMVLDVTNEYNRASRIINAFERSAIKDAKG